MSEQVKYDLPPRPEARTGSGWLVALAAIVFGAVIGFFVRPIAGRSIATETAPSAAAPAALLTRAELTALAEKLERNQLYAAAAQAWERAARQAPPEGPKKAEMLFRIGKNLSLANDHERALSYLFAAEAADEDGRWTGSINKLVLEGLSALGREDVRALQAAKRVTLDATGEDAPTVVAEIGGEPISELDLQSFARRMVTQQLSMRRQLMGAEAFEAAVESGLERFKSPEGRQQLLQMYLSQELLYREALAAGLPEEDAVRRRTIDARRQILTDAFLGNYLERNLHIDKTDLENAYEANKSDYVQPEAFKVDAIVVESEDAKKQASAALDAGTAFEEVRERFSTVHSDDESPGPFDRWISRDGWVPLVADSRAALAHIVSLATNEVGAKWIEGTGGKWIRFKRIDHRPARQLAFSECKDRVEHDLRAGKQRELLTQLQQSLQDKYDVVIHEDAINPENVKTQQEGT